MDISRSRFGMLIGLGAAAGAFGVLAMMSAATAPAARADDFTEIVSAVEVDYTAGQADFTTAFTDFGSNDVTAGLPALLDGLDDDLFSPGDSLLIGTAEALTNTPISGLNDFTFDLAPLTTSALTEAESYFSDGQAYLTDAATNLFTGYYVAAAFNEAAGINLAFATPLDELILGAAGSL
jgi:hypothetical protein